MNTVSVTPHLSSTAKSSFYGNIFLLIYSINVILWYLIVLVGSHCDKLGLRENKRVLSSAPPQHVSGFNYMDSGLVAVQRVQDDLEKKKTD